MKILLYFEAEKMIKTSGIGRARAHQIAMLENENIEYTCDPECEDFDILHVNTYGINSAALIKKAKKLGKKVVVHAHSTEEDFRNSFIMSNQLAPIFKKRLMSIYSQGDCILTPTPYSKGLLEGYGLTQPIIAFSNGIDVDKYRYDEEKVKAFRKYFSLNEDDKVIISVGLYFDRKGIFDFCEVAKRMPEYKFIWFGHSALYTIPKKVRDLVVENHPDNVIFPGYVKGAIIEGAYRGADCFFFASKEETEGIVVLEALASEQNVVVRDIPVFNPWLVNGENCYKGKDVDEFCDIIEKVINHELPSLGANGLETAKERSIARMGKKLKKIYEEVYDGDLK